jgi:acyl-[acyl-carrier-protein]-phospholipid O-acyltransferase/long-chain-fatty-acid--[acyl-carrier-protein] ligase
MIQWRKTVLRRALAWLYRIKIAGAANQAKGLVFIANHRSLLDGLVLGLFLPHWPLVIVNPEEVRTWWRKALYAAIPHVVIDVRQPRALRALLRLRESERSFVLFPEAIAGASFALRKIYEVPALFAAQCGEPLAPVYIERKRARKVTIHLHPHTSLQKRTHGSAKERRRASALELRGIMENMIVASGPDQTVFEAFLDALRAWGRRTKIIEDMREEPQSYGKLLKVSLALGRWLSRISRQNEAFGILLPNLSATVCSVLGATAFSRVPAMLNYTAGAAGIKNACIAANVKRILTSRKFLAHIKASALPASLPQFEWYYLEDVALNLPDKLWLLGYALWFPGQIVERKDGAGTAVILFTSGSEDRPRGVALSHAALLANIRQMRVLVDFSVQDKFLNPLPLYHSYSFTACTLMPLLSGTPLFLYPTPRHYRAIPEVAYRKKCTCLFGTGTFLARYAEYASAHDFAKVRYVIAGGEKLRSEVQSVWMQKFGLRILEGYGATECAPVIALNTPHRFAQNTVGHLLPGIEHRLSPVPGIKRGMLLHVRGPNVMSGYYRFERPGVLEPTQSEWGRGWYCTGDIVEIDEQGFVTIQGRAKRFAKIAGEMVSLEVVENIAARASPKAQHAAVAEADDERGEAIVVFTTDARLDRLLLHRAAHEAGWPTLALPRRIVHVKELPLLGTGKTDYVSLSQLPIQSPAPQAVQRAL